MSLMQILVWLPFGLLSNGKMRDGAKWGLGVRAPSVGVGGSVLAGGRGQSPLNPEY